MLTRRTALAGLTAMATPAPALARPEAEEIRIAMNDLFWGTSTYVRAGLKVLAEYGQPDIASTLIFALRFSRAEKRPFLDLLEQVTGASGDSWYDWMLWQEANPQVPSHPEYYTIKRNLFMAIEPNWAPFLRPELIGPGAMDIRLEEIAWGGVRRDGIPSLDFPDLIPADQADYLKPDDLVFGIEINGDIRAYPLRIMGWHEMFNDVIGGVPVALAYCTLCGAGILFETTLPGREDPLIMSTSGFLYRSNKLMYDRQTESLWNQFTGRPVHGALRGQGIALKQRPVAIARWADWAARNPGTRVLSLSTGYRRDYRSGAVYREYFASPDLMFPAVVDQSRLQQKSYVFGVRRTGAARAWPLTAFIREPVINDAVGDLPVVVIGDAAGRTARAYARGDVTFAPGPTSDTLTGGGRTWRVTEAALIAEDGTDDGAQAPRIAGHVAYWFAWDGYLGEAATLYQD